MRIGVIALVLASAMLAGCGLFGGGKEPADPKQVTRGAKRPPATRYEIELQVAVDVPQGTRALRLWVALPPSTAHQKIGERRVVPKPRFRYRQTTDSADNPLLAWDVEQPRAMRVAVMLTVDRRPIAMRLSPGRTRPLVATDASEHQRWLVAEPGVAVDDRMRDLVASIVGQRTNPITQARVLFDWLGRNITLDPAEQTRAPSLADEAGDGGGALDTLRADEASMTALYVALCRTAGLPARQCRGLTWPDAPAGQPLVTTERWWCEVWAPNIGWYPVDPAGRARALASAERASTTATPPAAATSDLASEGFGQLDGRRLLMARGRSLTLDPRQSGDALPLVRGAHAELDGQAAPTTWTLVVRKPKPQPKPKKPKKKKPTPRKRQPTPKKPKDTKPKDTKPKDTKPPTRDDKEQPEEQPGK